MDQPNAVPDRDGWRQVVEGHLPDVTYGANDGIITTVAVISGVEGAKLSSSVILILGFASVLADGASMGASKYLSKRSRHAPLQFPIACCVTAALLFGLGAARALFTRRGWVRSGLEMFLVEVGAGAAILA